MAFRDLLGGDSQQQNQSRFLQLSVLSLAACVFDLPVYFMSIDSPLMRYAESSVGVGIIAFYFLFRRTGHFRVWANAIFVVCVLLLLATHLALFSVTSVVSLWGIVLVMAALLWLDLVSSLVISMFAIFIPLLAQGLHSFAWAKTLAAPLDSDQIMSQTIQTCVAVAISSAVLFFLFLRMASHSLYRIRQSSFHLTELVRVMAHDMNNPLTVMMSYAHMLQTQSKETHSISSGAMIVQEARSVEVLLERIRDVRIIESGKYQLDCRPTPLLQTVSSLLLGFESMIEHKRIRIDMDQCSYLGTVWVDPELFSRRVVRLILENAIKYSYVDGVVSIRTEDTSSRVRLIIEDHGIGIPRERIDELFSYAHYSPRPGTCGEKGIGHALPLVQSALLLMKGRIRVDSRDVDLYPADSGTRITLDIPKEAT